MVSVSMVGDIGCHKSRHFTQMYILPEFIFITNGVSNKTLNLLYDVHVLNRVPNQVSFRSHLRSIIVVIEGGLDVWFFLGVGSPREKDSIDQSQ